MSQNLPRPPKLVLFDMDNVLCLYSRTQRIQYLARATGLTVTDIEQSIFSSGFEFKGDTGQYTAEEYLEGFRNRLDKKATNNDWIEARHRSMHPDMEMLSLAKALKQKVQVAVLTNNGPALRQVIDDVFPALVETFRDNIFFSCQFKTAKPDPKIYTEVADRLSAEPSDILFIDDLKENIDGAIAAGMKGHHFQGIDNLQKLLLDLGLF